MRWRTFGRTHVVAIDQLAEAALRRDAIQLRALVHELLSAYPDVGNVPAPLSSDSRVQAASAGLVELLALRRAQNPPPWSERFGALDEPFYLLASAANMRRLRDQCKRESPDPLRERKLYAPADFLTFA